MEGSLDALFKNLKALSENEKLVDPLNEQVLKLAFLGDTLFGIITRNYLISKYSNSIKINEMHNKNSELVCAKNQSMIADKLVDELLTDDEIDFFKHARNAHSHSKSKNSSIVDYRKATGLEALLAFLFYKDENRLKVIMAKIIQIFDEINI
ncbi:MAG: RNAase [Lachnospiraceae bacterium]|nr:RNAase [Lachnospiraceae bacterium]